MTKRTRLSELKAFLELCFVVLVEKTEGDPREMCNLTGLSIGTVRRYWVGDCTLNIRYGTVQAIGMAAGFRFELHKVGVIMRVIK